MPNPPHLPDSAPSPATGQGAPGEATGGATTSDNGVWGAWQAARAAKAHKPSDPQQASIGLVTLNARFVHMALSLRYLRNVAKSIGFPNTWISEYTIQTPPWKMAAEIMAHNPAVLGFSIYIWNRQPTLALIELLKKQNPALLVVVGGPEVSFDPQPPPYVDVVISGEGEEKWAQLLHTWARGETPRKADLARWATYGTDLPTLTDTSNTRPFSPEDLHATNPGLADRLVYVETSRGCPYTCAFCLSSLDKKMRFLPEATVRETIDSLVKAGARRIKFLDRTFNLGKKRVTDLFQWLMGFEGVEFHFEVVGDLLDDEMLALLDKAPPGRFQFEIGIQSALEDTQALIDRRQEQSRLFGAITRLKQADRVHMHADLIWGLPGETLAHIQDSFEQVFALRPHELQLGFLKFLPGAPIRRDIARFGYVFQDAPPYEIIANKHLSAEELLALKRFEMVFGLYYNSGKFQFSLERLLETAAPWQVFTTLADHFLHNGLLVPAHGLEALCGHLLAAFAPQLSRLGIAPEEFRDLVKLDYCHNHRAKRVPEALKGPPVPETEAVRDYRRRHPQSAVAAFWHSMDLQGDTARLTPSPNPLWVAFDYPPKGGSYFFRPQVHQLDSSPNSDPSNPRKQG